VNVYLGIWNAENDNLSINQSLISLVNNLKNITDHMTDLTLQTLKIIAFSSPPFFIRRDENASIINNSVE